VESVGPIQVSDLPEIREPVTPDAPPVRAAAPVALNGRIDPAGDEDRYTLAVTPGQTLHIEVEAAESGSALDGVLQILGPNGSALATADDTTVPPQGGKRGKAAGVVSPDPSLDFTPPAGVSEVTISIKDLQGRGGVGFPYRIVVAPAVPRFEIALNDAQVNLPRGGTSVVGVTVSRNGYNGPITVDVAHRPAGMTVRPGLIADGQAVGSFSFSAAPDAAIGLVTLDVVGEGQGQGPSAVIRSHALKHQVFAQQANVPTNTLTQIGLPTAQAPAPALTLDAPSDPIDVAHGYGTTIAIKIARPPGADGALTLASLPLPPGLTVPEAKVAEKALEGTVTVNTAVTAPLGRMTIALVAKGKVANADHSFGVPAVTLNVARPASVALTTGAIELKAGTTAELKGKLKRLKPFQEPVTVSLKGLPAGLKAEPVKIAPDASEFSVAIIADPKAASTTAQATVTLAFQVDKKDYGTPPTPFSVKVLPASP
jgi:hypothetical protein